MSIEREDVEVFSNMWVELKSRTTSLMDFLETNTRKPYKFEYSCFEYIEIKTEDAELVGIPYMWQGIPVRVVIVEKVYDH